MWGMNPAVNGCFSAGGGKVDVTGALLFHIIKQGVVFIRMNVNAEEDGFMAFFMENPIV